MCSDKLKAGVWILHFDEDPNGHTIYQQARVVRARGGGVLVDRPLGDTIARYRVPRSDVVRVIPPPTEEKS